MVSGKENLMTKLYPNNRNILKKLEMLSPSPTIFGPYKKNVCNSCLEKVCMFYNKIRIIFLNENTPVYIPFGKFYQMW